MSRCLGWGVLLAASTLVLACSGESSSSGGEGTSSRSAAGGSTGAYPNEGYSATGGSSSGADWTGTAAGGTTALGGSTALPPASNEGDRYESPGTNPFVLTAHDPLSTFAADVDTASYDIFRRDINLGILPHSDGVRLEEYINYFPYDYPAPATDSETPFSISLAATPNIIDTTTTLLRVGIQGKLAPAEEDKPASLVFLIDTSGSMQSADKLPLVKSVLNETLEILAPTDTISIVTYASGTGVRLAPTPVSEANTIRSVIDNLSAGGSTNGAGGIELAYEQAGAAFIEGGINHVVLCTDGDFNVGLSSDQELVDLIEEKRKSGVTLTALGFGIGNLNDSMMEKVSNAGNGIYGVISSEQQALRYVHERMLSTLVLIAKDLKIQVEFNSERVTAYRLLGYENRAIADDDFRNDVVDAGEIGAGHQVTALYELVLAGSEVPVPEAAPEPLDGEAFSGTPEVLPEDLVLVKLRYKDVDASEEDPAYEVAASLNPSEAAASFAEGSDDLKFAISIAGFAEILKKSPYAKPAALDTMAAVFESQSAKDSTRVEFYELFKKAKSLLP